MNYVLIFSTGCGLTAGLGTRCTVFKFLQKKVKARPLAKINQTIIREQTLQRSKKRFSPTSLGLDIFQKYVFNEASLEFD